MDRTVDLSALPVKQYGGKTHIDWKKAAGYQIPFAYDEVRGYLVVASYQKGNRVVIGYEGRYKTLRTHQLMELKFSDLIYWGHKIVHRRNAKTHDAFVKEVEKLYHGEYTVLSKYTGSKAPVLLRHNCAACGYHQFSPTPNNFLRGSGCPLCNGSPSFPETCLLLALLGPFPDATKQKIERRECDIVFCHGGKRFGLQYDGSFYHADAGKDDAFDQLFLKEEENYLIRVREKGCPGLKRHHRLYVVEAPSSYSRESLQGTLDRVLCIVNRLLGTEFRIELTEELIHKARRESKKAHHYVLLINEYLSFLHEHCALPRNREENGLQERIALAIRENRFTPQELAMIREVQRKYGLYREERKNEEIYRDMLCFFHKNGMMPRQQAGDAVETALYREIKSCIKKRRFDRDQELRYEELKRLSSNYVMPSEELVRQYLHFVSENGRLPSAEGAKAEKALASKVYHRVNRGTFTPAELAQVEELKFRYSAKQVRQRILSEYRQFIKQNGRLPLSSAKGEEGKLAGNILRYLRTGQFDEKECLEVMELRRQHLTLARRQREYLRYCHGDQRGFALREYEAFCMHNGHPPIKGGHEKDEDALWKLAETWHLIPNEQSGFE